MFVQKKNYSLHQLNSLFFYYDFLISTFTYSLLMQNKCCNATLQFAIGQKALSVLGC